MESKTAKKKVLLLSIFCLFTAQIAALNISFAKIDYQNPVLSQISETAEATQEIEKYRIYISTGCPHCAVVEEFVENSNLNDLATVNFYDTSIDPSYGDEMIKLVEARGYQYEGVPTMIAGQDVVVGDTPIINYFRTKFPDLQENVSSVADSDNTQKEAVDWGKWAVTGLVGLSGLVVVVLLVMSFI